MITDCIAIFKKELDQYSDALILDNYVPKDGTYLLLKITDQEVVIVESMDIKYVKKTNELIGKDNKYFKILCYLDYKSKLVEMNKPMDSKKIVHSNNFLSFAVKKESLATKKVTTDIIEGYYNILRDPGQKYSKKAKSREIYKDVEADFGLPDVNMINLVEGWIKENLFSLDVDITKKDYLKLFFVLENEQESRKLYEQESNRYLIPNLYNSNDFNIENDGDIYGLPNDNMGMNAKKPYLENKTRKVSVPYLLNRDDALLQNRFFDYLMGQASIGNGNVYVDTDNETIKFYKPTESPGDIKNGYFLRIQKGKEIEIHNWNQIAGFNPNLKDEFSLKQIVKLKPEDLDRFEPGYGLKTNLMELNILIDNVFFSKSLFHNYFTDPGDLSITDGVLKSNIIVAREKLFGWFYRGEARGVDLLLEKVSIQLIKNSIRNGNLIKVKHQLNLRWSLMDYFTKTRRMEESMKNTQNMLRKHINAKEDWEFEDEKEYYFAVGQLVAFYLSKMRTKKKSQSFVNPFLNATTDKVIKRRLVQMYKHVNYDIDYYTVRANNMVSRVLAYEPAGVVNQEMLISGFTWNSLIYEKKEEKKDDE